MEAQRTSRLSLHTVKAPLLHDTKTAKSYAFIMSKKKYKVGNISLLSICLKSITAEKLKIHKIIWVQNTGENWDNHMFFTEEDMDSKTLVLLLALLSNSCVSLSKSESCDSDPTGWCYQKDGQGTGSPLSVWEACGKANGHTSARYSAHADILCFCNFKEHLHEVWIFP